MRSYDEYCSVAKTLDVVGDRWTLLIVRELLLRGASRYTDLRNGLPGIATNLLADRLRELEHAGVVSRREAAPPVATTVFTLTERGRALEPVLDELARWGVPYMVDGPAPGDAFRAHWLAWPARLFLRDRDPGGPPVEIALAVDGEDAVLESDQGEIWVRPGRAEHPAAEMTGPPYAILGVLSGRVDPERAGDRGLTVSGDVSALRRLLPD